jgi:hypothetical protein
MPDVTSHGACFVITFFHSVASLISCCDAKLLGTCRKLANALLTHADEPTRGTIGVWAVEMLGSIPTSALIFASAYQKTLSHPDARTRFSEAALPRLIPIVESGDVAQLTDVYHMLARCLASDVPQFLIDNVAFVGQFVQGAFALLSREIPAALCEYCLAFFAAVVRNFGGSPAFVDLACHFGASHISPVIVGRRIEILYWLLRPSPFIDFMHDLFDTVFRQIILPQMDGCDDERRRMWKTPFAAARELTIAYFATFDDLIASFPAFVASTQGEELLAVLVLFESIAKVEIHPGLIFIQCLAAIDRSAVEALIEWLIAIVASAGDDLRHVILRLMVQCDVLGLPMRFITPILPLMSSDTEAILAVATLLPGLPDAEELALREKLVEAAPSLFALFVTFGPIVGSTGTLLALRRLIDAIAPSLTAFPRAIVADFVQVFAADLQGKTTCGCGVRAALRHIFALVPIDFSEFLAPLAELTPFAPAIIDAILDMMISIIRGRAPFREEFCEYAHFAFGLLTVNKSVQLFDISDFITNLIWCGAEHLGRFADNVLELAAQARSDWQDPLDCAAYLEIVAAIGRILPATVSAILPECTNYAALQSVDGQGNLWPFIEFLAVAFPEVVAGNLSLLRQVIFLGKPLGCFVAQMAMATALGPERTVKLITDMQGCEDVEDMDSTSPVWYDADAVAAQYAVFLEELQAGTQLVGQKS